ncbi:PP2C family protein-serine/threonine phosphatase [Modestobacter sp. VKM Ac-2986]|uniref:PP2C family protein-serine/threonine phosphatase n=1 Tax=Modestobacter sp. VKM Ac-2986 TaxID=3004140 RepID=UPI0022AB2CDA|nr:PP2C family protein-serine/threonine phosphatase [Modestobacter sp. VKM Ac-2986]MCZ2828978.1 PP2C family protein-serine/threonine phosphatase [Modestobacter sp. VKM Ac-2986]
MSRRHLLPLGVLALCTAVDLAAGPGQVLIGLLAMAPLVAAVVLGRGATIGYGLAAFALAVLLGFYDRQYTDAAVLGQSFRLLGMVVSGVIAVLACTLRLRREAVIARLSTEAATSRAAVQLAASLQRSLLTEPPVVPGLEMAVRYLPAMQHAQVGGDWYDAFPLADGTTMLVIGDVAGHDVAAAATMAQARGVLRGIASTMTGSPAAVLSALDRALLQLRVETLMTVAAATVRPGADGGTTFTWSNAGHPPPVLVRADGSVSVLRTPTDLLLGITGTARRADHSTHLSPGDTVLLYTDGLVERRGSTLDEGTDWLVEALTPLAGRPLEELCDVLLEGMAGAVPDDVAVLAVRVRA